MIRSIRDYFTTDMDEVLIDDPEVYREAREFFEVVMPDHVGLVKLHQERRPIFSRYQIEEQIETINRNKVPLPSGGSIVIDTTEALVAIDVNSGKMAGETNVEATATRTNLEAAEEVARQLRLRDLGGLIVIDFIDMRDRKHNRQVEDRLKEATARDKARITIGHISQFGMLEMSRQRIKPALTEGAFRICPALPGRRADPQRRDAGRVGAAPSACRPRQGADRRGRSADGPRGRQLPAQRETRGAGGNGAPLPGGHPDHRTHLVPRRPGRDHLAEAREGKGRRRVCRGQGDGDAGQGGSGRPTRR